MRWDQKKNERTNVVKCKRTLKIKEPVLKIKRLLKIKRTGSQNKKVPQNKKELVLKIIKRTLKIKRAGSQNKKDLKVKEPVLKIIKMPLKIKSTGSQNKKRNTRKERKAIWVQLSGTQRCSNEHWVARIMTSANATDNILEIFFVATFFKSFRIPAELCPHFILGAK